MCSYALTSEIAVMSETRNTHLSSALNSNGRKNTLRAGHSIYSRKGGFKLTMHYNCNLVLRNRSGKVLFSSNTVNKGKNCRAILRNNSNIIVVAGRRKQRFVVWSTKNDMKLTGRRHTPYRLRINGNGNVIVSNRKRQCVWASFGCPKKKMLKKLNKMDPAEAAEIVKRENNKLRKTLKGPQVGIGPVDPKKPAIKNPVPKRPTPQRPTVRPANVKVKPAPRPKIGSETVSEIKNILSEGTGKSNIRQVVSLVKGLIPKKQVNALKNQLKNGLSVAELKEIADRKIAALKAKAAQKAKTPAKKPETAPRVKSNSQLVNQVKSTPWAQKVKTIIKNGGGFSQIKQVLQKSGFNNASRSYWNNIRTQVRKNNFQATIRYVVVRPAPYVPRVVYTPRVYVRRWVIRYRSYLTYYWGGYWGIRWGWRWYCRGWWWWRRCWVGSYAYWQYIRYPVWYWRSYSYWSYE